MKNHLPRFVALFFSLVLIKFGFSQINGYNIAIKKTSLKLPALHSYSWAQHQGKVLIVGGRKDGIHPRQPFASFPNNLNNDSLYVIDFDHNQYFSAHLKTLSTSLQEQLKSSNMNFHQVEDTLYLIGGYGFSATASDHITYPYLSTIIVSEVIKGIVNKTDFKSSIKQIQSDSFAVTGGHLGHIDGKLYLVGGHRFDGRYNPMGHATYTQTYTNSTRIFSCLNSNSPTIQFSNSYYNESHLRRRDYNLVPQIFEDGSFGYLISSGVFQKTTDLPFLYPVEIHHNQIKPIEAFNQYLSNYHSACASIFDTKLSTQYHLFFGGLSQYDLINESLVKNDQVPFVKTISLVKRDSKGNYEEFKLEITMPDYLGSSAEFITNENLPMIENEIFDFNKLSGDSILLGYVFGGIQSQTENPFSDNSPELSQAAKSPLAVYLIKGNSNLVNMKKVQGISVFPNPNSNGKVKVKFPESLKNGILNIEVFNTIGQLLQSSQKTIFQTTNEFEFDIDSKITNQLLTVKFRTPEHQFYTTNLILNR